MIGCICGGVIEGFLITIGFGFVITWVRKICKKRGCQCKCHKEKQ